MANVFIRSKRGILTAVLFMVTLLALVMFLDMMFTEGKISPIKRTMCFLGNYNCEVLRLGKEEPVADPPPDKYPTFPPRPFTKKGSTHVTPSHESHSKGEKHAHRLFDDNALQCIERPSKDIHTLFDITEGASLKKERVLVDEHEKNFHTTPSPSANPTILSNHSVYVQMDYFAQLMHTHGVEVLLIEPSILFCMLRSYFKLLLLKRGFNVQSLLGSEKVVTFAAKEGNGYLLNDVKINSDLKSKGFKHWSVQSEPSCWYKTHHPEAENLTTHHFYERRGIVMHIVVFCNQSHYLWHGNLNEVPYDLQRNFSKGDFLFAEYDSIYERFSSLQAEQQLSQNIKVVSNPQHFLFQIDTSKFLECNYTEAEEFKKIKVKDKGYYPVAKLEEAFAAALEGLKYELQPLMMSFLIWGGTLLGWYRQCGIIPYTSDVDFFAFSWDIDSEKDIITTIKNHPNFQLKIIMGIVKEAFELSFNTRGVKIDLFFLYKDGDKVWISGHRPSRGYYFRYSYPAFKTCSADLLGYKVQVPCDPEAIIRAEYGPDWTKPVSYWAYDASPKNMGPKKYWPKELLPIIYPSV